MEKRTLFRMALAVKSDAGDRYTVKDFAAAHGVSDEAIHSVLRGDSTSRRLESAIDAFIDEQLSVYRRKTRDAVPA